jgi:DamX protein
MAANAFVAMDVKNANHVSESFEQPLTPPAEKNVTQKSSAEPQPVALSLAETKTFERLEAYVNDSKPVAPAPITVDEKNLLEGQANDYTLQLMGVRDIHELKRFVRDNNLQDARIFHTYYLNNDWYVLVYGRYQTHTEALKAIESIPSSIQQLKPWVRQLCSIQKAIQLYR